MQCQQQQYLSDSMIKGSNHLYMYRFMLLYLQHYNVNKKDYKKTKHCNNMAPTFNYCAVETEPSVMCVCVL